jgi:AcrR family transcriptional regulator
MPTSTFFNLPEEKRKKLVFAIKEEFSRVPFDEASINKIVHTAEIPRGSFYQYFNDKNDMLEFILLDYQKQMIEQVKVSLRENNGDIFFMITDILDFTIDFVMEEKANNFCMNLFADIKVNSKFYLKMPRNAADKKISEELKPWINFELLDLREEDDLTNIIDILFSICRDATTEIFLRISDYEIVKQKYLQKLQLLRRGFTKKKE